MTSERSPAGAGLGARLRATAQEPEDHAAAALRARLRHKMFGVGVPSAPPAPELPPDVPASRLHSPTLPLSVLGWIVPSVAVLALAAMMLWQRHGGRPDRPIPVPRLPSSTRVLPEAEPAPPPADEGPGLLAAASARDDSAALMAAVRASWADVDAPQRLDATMRLAETLREEGQPRRAIGLLRTVLDELELGMADRAGRARLLQALASCYELLGRERAAAAVRAEARRLDPASADR